ncbi:MAG: PD40 domain-containing protein, partial [Candidatus Solibacter usitatus]|nr:PD40 domain-containing protein [Candidatus Solibacter usitatus]
EEGEEVAVQWLEASGRETELTQMTGANWTRISPDGKRLAYLSNQGGHANLWNFDWQRNVKTKMTFEHDPERFAWTPDSRAVIFSSTNSLYWTRADGAARVQKLREERNGLFIHDIAPDGKTVSFARSGGQGQRLMLAPLEYKGAPSGDAAPQIGKPEPCCDEGGRGVTASRFSSDGKWIAYNVLEALGTHVYVRSVPDSGAKWQVSGSEGGASPVWSPNGRELFFKTTLGRIMAVDYTTKAGVFTPGTPRLWTEHRVPGNIVVGNLSLAPDGKRMVVLGRLGEKRQETAPAATVLVHFFEEVRRRAQASGQ